MKLVRILIFTMVLTLSFGSVSTLAKNQPFSFTFKNKTSTKSTDSYKKDDSDKNWYISLYDEGSTMSAKNTFGAKTCKFNGTSASEWATFSRYVFSYGLKYTATVAAGDKIYMTGRKNSTSTSSSNLEINGTWCP